MKRWGISIATLLAAALLIASWRNWVQSSLTESLGFVTGAACVYLLIEQNIWNFPIGIANNIFFIVLFIGARLYADAGLQVVYLALAVHGWYLWLYGGEKRTGVRVEPASWQNLVILAGLCLIATFGLRFLLLKTNDSAPALDALTTALSLVAQYMLNRKLIENWLVWILADIIYIYLYARKGLPLTAILYAIFIGLCIAGLMAWRRSLAEVTAKEEREAALAVR